MARGATNRHVISAGYAEHGVGPDPAFPPPVKERVGVCLVLLRLGLPLAHAGNADPRFPPGAPRHWIRSPAALRRDLILTETRDPPLPRRGGLDAAAMRRRFPGAMMDRKLRFRAQPKQGRIEVKVAELGPGLALELRTAGRRVVGLDVLKGSARRSLLPDVPISIGEKNEAFNGTRKAGYPFTRIVWRGDRDRRSLFGLLHEIGHFLATARVSRKARVEAVESYQHDLRSERQARVQIGWEREAWAYALLQVRQLRREGFDLFAGVSDEELLGHLHIKLKTYLEWGGVKDLVSPTKPKT
jgi:hypothetical protein